MEYPSSEDTFVLKSIFDYFIQGISQNLKCDGEVRGRFIQLYIEIVNHELRTPITCIQTAIELLNRNSILSENEKKRIYHIIEKNVRRLMKSIDILFKI